MQSMAKCENVRQAYTARRAEQMAIERAEELHMHEVSRQREHEQMLAQCVQCNGPQL